MKSAVRSSIPPCLGKELDDDGRETVPAIFQASTRIFSLGASADQPLEYRGSDHHSGGLTLSGSSPGKARARMRVRVAPGSTMWTRIRPVIFGLVGIGAEQALERGLGRAVGAPEGARLGADRRGERDDVGFVGALAAADRTPRSAPGWRAG